MKALFDTAEENNIEIYYSNTPLCKSIAINNHICMDYSLMWQGAEERVHLAHELGHCVTGSFYNRWAARDVRQRHENKADKWAIKKLVPKDELLKAIKSGHINIWDLADYFNVTEDFMKKAMHWYIYGNLAVE